MKKRILSIILTLALCLSLLPTAALGTTSVNTGNVIYTSNDGTKVESGTGT